MSALFVVLIVVGGFVLCGLIIDGVRDDGEWSVPWEWSCGGVGRTSVVAFCCGGVLMEKRLIN